MLESCNLDIMLPNHDSSLAAADIFGVRVTLGWGYFVSIHASICAVAKDNCPKKAN